MNNSNKRLLSDEQNLILNNTSKYLSVIATAGSGKTFTLVEKAKKILEKNDKNVLILSFTNAAVTELNSRFSKSRVKPKIKTFDSLFLDLFFEYYHLEESLSDISPIDRREIKINYGTNMINNVGDFVREIEFNKTLFAGINHNKINIFKNYVVPNILNKHGILNILSCQYSHLLVDESQDMNIYEIEFINMILKFGKVGIVAFGDYYQTIFRWRGSDPEKTKELFKNFGFTELSMTKSFRCPDSIYGIAKQFRFEGDINLDFLEKFLYKKNEDYWICTAKTIDQFFTNNEANEKLRRDVLNQIGLDLSGETTVLVQVNNTVDRIIGTYDFSTFKKNINIFTKYGIYFESFSIDKLADIYFNNDIEYILDEVLELNPKLRDDFNDVLYRNYLSSNLKSFNNFVQFLKHYLSNYIGLDEISVNEIDFSKIRDNFSEIEQYSIKSKQNIMTIHNSKGREFDNIILCLDSSSISRKEFKEQVFVGMTRAKKKLLILLVEKI